jgi:hypothetical protein
MSLFCRFDLKSFNLPLTFGLTGCVLVLGLSSGCKQRPVTQALPASSNAGNEGDLEDQAQVEYIGFISRKVSISTTSNGGILFALKLEGNEEKELLAIDLPMIEFLENCLKDGRRIRVGVRLDPSYNPKNFPPSQPDLLVLKAEEI